MLSLPSESFESFSSSFKNAAGASSGASLSVTSLISLFNSSSDWEGNVKEMLQHLVHKIFMHLICECLIENLLTIFSKITFPVLRNSRTHASIQYF